MQRREDLFTERIVEILTRLECRWRRGYRHHVSDARWPLSVTHSESYRTRRPSPSGRSCLTCAPLAMLRYPTIALLLLGAGAQAQRVHTLMPSPSTVAFGYYDAAAVPVLRVQSGDEVVVGTLITNNPTR